MPTRPTARSPSPCPTRSASTATATTSCRWSRDAVDILFANEAEACALWGCDEAGAAVERARAEVAVACITLSEKGSVVVTGPETYEIPAHPVEVVDTTGAGDLYAAGFLYGYTTGRSLPQSGELGSLAAAEVISHIGARPEINLATLLDGDEGPAT